jgi:hypothetical protein
MKKVFVFCVSLALWLSVNASIVWAVDVGWMQKGVRAWYFGAVGSTTSSDAEEAYLFGTVNGNNVQVTKHSGLNHWGTANAPDTSTYSLLDKGPCWIHPQVLQTLQSGDTWKGQVIATVLRESHTYNSFKAQFSFPYLLLPMKALFDLKAQRDLVKIVYYIQGYSTGIAYFDADTGLLLLYQTSNGLVTVFFLLSEINYDFATQRAFAEDNGPHTGFKSSFLEQQLMPFPDNRGGVVLQSSVESRYGTTVQMWVSTSESGNISSYMPPFESHCFFGSVPVLRRINMTDAPNHPPDQWNAYGQHLWWWVPTGALQNAAINVFGVPMTRTSTNPYTFTATQQSTGFFFPKLWFDNDGYVTAFSAKDSTTGLDIDPEQIASYYNNSTTVDGLAYYKNTMGRATPAARQSKVGAFRPSDGTFYLDYDGSGTWNGCGTDRCLQIGMNGDIALVGDWNGTGTSKVGAFRPSDGTFYLDYNGNGIWDGCGVDRCLHIGMLNDIPLVGDWNGSGTSKVGAFRPSDGTFYLDYNGSGTWEGCGTDRCLQIGLTGDVPLVGDWNGTGTSKVGAFRPSDGTFYLDYNGSGTWEGCGTDRCLSIGMNGDTPLVGKW